MSPPEWAVRLRDEALEEPHASIATGLLEVQEGRRRDRKTLVGIQQDLESIARNVRRIAVKVGARLDAHDRDLARLDRESALTNRTITTEAIKWGGKVAFALVAALIGFLLKGGIK